MKKLFLFLTLLIAGITANAQYSPSNNLNYIKLLKVPPVGAVEDSVLVYDGSDLFVKMRPSSVLIGKATATKTGTVKTNVTEADPVVYTKNTTDELLDLKKNATSTAVTSTATLTNNGATFTLSPLTGVIVDNSTVPSTRTVINFAGASNVTPLYFRTLLYIDNTGTLQQMNGASTDLTPQQKVDNLFIGIVVYSGGTVQVVQLIPNIEYGIDNRFSVLTDFLRNINEGNNIGANGANLQINKGAGYTFRRGSNFAANREVPDVTTDAAATPIPASPNLIGYRNGSGGWTYEPYTGSLTPQFWDDGSGVKATVANNKFTNQRVYFFNGTNTYVIYLGRTEHATLLAAKTAAKDPDAIVDPATSVGSLIGTVSVAYNATALNNTAQADFTQGPRMQGGTGAGGASGSQNLQNTYLNSSVPQITTTALGAVTIQEGTGNDANNVLVGKNNAGTTTFSVKGNGDMSGNDTTLNSANITNSASINSLSVAVNPVHSTGSVVVRESTSGNYGTASQQTIQNIVGIGGDFASNPSLLLFQGDSMTAGVPPADPYPNSIVTTNIFDKENNAVGSKTIATIRIEAPTLDDVLYRFSARENIYILWAGTNDLYNTYDVATTFKNLEATCRERQKKGFKVIVLTTVPRCGFAADGVTTMASLISDYNALIRQRWSTFADNIADVASNSTLNSVNPCIDTTYYNGDGIHLTNTGNALLLPYVQDAIDEMSVQTTFQDVNIKGNIVQPITIKKAFGTSETALIINNTSELNGNLGAIDFKARNAGFGDNGMTSRIESISNGASIGQTVLNIKVAENAVSLNTILSMDGVTKNSTFSGALSATTYSGSASLTGTPTAPTAVPGSPGNQIANLDFVFANSIALSGNQTLTGRKTLTSDNTTAGGLSVTNSKTSTSTYGDNYGIYVVNSGTGGLLVNNSSVSNAGIEVANYGGNGVRLNSFATTDPLLTLRTQSGTSDLFSAELGKVRITSSGDLRADTFVSNGKIRLKNYTVATLPAGTQGDTAYVTDATAPTYLGTLTGGGSVVCPVFYNGTAWVSH